MTEITIRWLHPREKYICWTDEITCMSPSAGRSYSFFFFFPRYNRPIHILYCNKEPISISYYEKGNDPTGENSRGLNHY